MKKYENPTINISLFTDGANIFCESNVPQTMNYEGFLTQFDNQDKANSITGYQN